MAEAGARARAGPMIQKRKLNGKTVYEYFKPTRLGKANRKVQFFVDAVAQEKHTKEYCYQRILERFVEKNGQVIDIVVRNFQMY